MVISELESDRDRHVFMFSLATCSDTRAGKNINSLIEMARVFAHSSRGLLQNHALAALPEILVGLTVSDPRRERSHRGQLLLP
jgi:hypothetical protein